MRSKRLLAALLTLSLTAGVALVGCGSNNNNEGNNKDNKKEDTAKEGEKEEAKMDKEQYMNVDLQAEPKTLDGSKGTDLYCSQILAETMEGLTRIEQDDSGKDIIKPAGAEKWEQSEDGLKWTFHLRDYKWSDGKPVTAQDFVYGITRTLAPEVGSTYAFLLYPIKGAQDYNGNKAGKEAVGVKAVDDKTLEITLENPCAYFLDLTYFKTMYPLRQDIVEKHGDKYGTEANTMVFCGPFVMKNWVHQNKIELEKNKDYWDAEHVNLEKLTFKIIKEETSRMNEVYNGSLDMAPVSHPDWVKKLDGTKKFTVQKAFDPSTGFSMFNQKDKYFKNVKIRKAFVVGADREGYATIIQRGIDDPATAWAPPSLQLNGEDFRKQADNLPLVKLKEENPDPKALLIEGLKEAGLDADPAKADITFLATGTSARHREIAEFNQQAYKKSLGVNLKADYVEWPIFQKRTDEYDYQMGTLAWTGDYNDPMTFFDMWVTGADIEPVGWSNAKYDDLIKKAGSTLDPKVRLEAFKEAENILLYEDAVISPLTFRKRNTYIRNYVKGYMRPLFGVPEYKYAYTEGRGK